MKKTLLLCVLLTVFGCRTTQDRDTSSSIPSSLNKVGELAGVAADTIQKQSTLVNEEAVIIQKQLPASAERLRTSSGILSQVTGSLCSIKEVLKQLSSSALVEVSKYQETIRSLTDQITELKSKLSKQSSVFWYCMIGIGVFVFAGGLFVLFQLHSKYGFGMILSGLGTVALGGVYLQYGARLALWGLILIALLMFLGAVMVALKLKGLFVTTSKEFDALEDAAIAGAKNVEVTKDVVKEIKERLSTSQVALGVKKMQSALRGK